MKTITVTLTNEAEEQAVHSFLNSMNITYTEDPTGRSDQREYAEAQHPRSGAEAIVKDAWRFGT